MKLPCLTLPKEGLHSFYHHGQGRGWRIIFSPHCCFFGSSTRRRKLFYLIPPCTEQRARCVPGNTLSSFGSLRHAAAELCPLLNAGSQQRGAPAVPPEGPAGLSSCSPGQAGACHLAQADSPFPPQVTAKSAAPSALLASISQDTQQEREFRGELSWREPLSAQVGLERSAGKESCVLPSFGNATIPELLLLCLWAGRNKKHPEGATAWVGPRAQHHGQQCHHGAIDVTQLLPCHPNVPTPPQVVPAHHTRAAPRPSPTAGQGCPSAGWK